MSNQFDPTPGLRTENARLREYIKLQNDALHMTRKRVAELEDDLRALHASFSALAGIAPLGKSEEPH